MEPTPIRPPPQTTSTCPPRGGGTSSRRPGLLGWLIAVFGLLILPISRKLEREHQHEDVSAIERAT